MEILLVIARTLNYRRYVTLRNFCAIAALVLLCAAGLLASQQRSAKPKPPAPASPTPPVAPFHAGEILNYSGQWLKVNDVVSATLSIMDDHPFDGHPAWHFHGQVHTKNPLRYLYPVDDQFDSYSSHVDFTGMQFEMYLHQPGKQENHIQKLSATPAPAPAAGTLVQVLPGTRDALGFFYFLRTVNWKSTPEVRMPVYDGHKLYEARASVLDPRSDVTVLAGNFVATGIAVRIFDNGAELTAIKVTIWLAQDAAHTPVLIEADLPFGSGRVELAPQSN
jgi:hypothetical protein